MGGGASLRRGAEGCGPATFEPVSIPVFSAFLGRSQTPLLLPSPLAFWKPMEPLDLNAEKWELPRVRRQGRCSKQPALPAPARWACLPLPAELRSSCSGKGWVWAVWF